MSTVASVRPSSSATSTLTSPATTNAVIPTLAASKVATTSSPDTLQRYSSPYQSAALRNKQSQPLPSTPGSWRHPREDEIMHRLNRTNFDKTNIYIVIRNAVLLASSFGVRSALDAIAPASTVQWLEPTAIYILLALRLLLLLNIGLALIPLLRKADTCEDIPLTPSQRLLFGLPPLARPATPQEKEQYTTPPRYSRSASGTPRSSSSSLHPEVSGSPLDLSDRTAPFTGSTPFRSPSGSPLSGLQPPRGSGERRKLSYTANRSSPLSISEFEAAGSVNTPTKAAGNRASVGLNSKWLYEKGKANGNAWATGSTFS